MTDTTSTGKFFSSAFSYYIAMTLMSLLLIVAIYKVSSFQLFKWNSKIIYIFEKKNDMDPKNPFIRLEKKF